MEIIIFLIQITITAAALAAVFYCIKQLFALIAVVYLLYKCYKAGGGDAELMINNLVAELEKRSK